MTDIASGNPKRLNNKKNILPLQLTINNIQSDNDEQEIIPNGNDRYRGGCHGMDECGSLDPHWVL